jgi:hypothetical protein
METTVVSITAYDKDHIDCVKHKRDIMITYTTANGKNVVDLFLAQTQAKVLANDLTIMIKRNEAKKMKKKYIVEGNHPIFKDVNLEINRLDELSLKIGNLLANGYKITIKPWSEQIDKPEPLGDILRSAMDKAEEQPYPYQDHLYVR